MLLEFEGNVQMENYDGGLKEIQNAHSHVQTLM